MLVKDIVKTTCKVLELSDVLEYLESLDKLDQGTIDASQDETSTDVSTDNSTDTSASDTSDDATVSSDVTETLDRLLVALNLVNNTLASQYFEINSCKKISNTSGVIAYSSVSSRNIVDIKKVCSDTDVAQKFALLSDGIHTGAGNCKVYYTYLPEDVGLSDSIDYYIKLSETTFAFGVACEYLFLIGDIENASVWDKRFKDTLFAISRPRRNFSLPVEEWY